MEPRDVVARVSIMVPIDRVLDYRVPGPLEPWVRIGTRVLVPLGKRMVTGYVIEKLGADESATRPERQGRVLRYRDIVEVLDEEPLFDPPDLRFFQWISRYYFAPLGEVIRTALPVSMHVRSMRAARILDKGRKAVTEGLISDPLEGDVLRALLGNGELTVKRLRSISGKAIPPRVLDTLEQKGFVETFLKIKRRQGPTHDAMAGGHAVYEAANGHRQEESWPGPPPVLTAQQQAAMNAIIPSLHRGTFSPFLLHGITGSGKTEIYIRVIEECLRIGKEGLVLVPEIALTPQTVRLFSERLKTSVTVLHSGLSEGERLTYWWKIRKGEVKIAIGARSAVFAPFRNLGTIVVDEEHDPSYKQEDRVRYHARDLALVRGNQSRATVILGSATPSLESYYNAQTGKCVLLELNERVEQRPLPEVTIVNMTDPMNRTGPESSFSPCMRDCLTEAFSNGTQSLVFLNRRGFAHTLVCRDCGFLFRCPNCSITLTFHMAGKRLCCHYCDYRLAAPSLCPGCRGTRIHTVGRGTERVEKELESLLLNARIARMDRDTTRRKGSHEKILDAFRKGALDVLIGTQMIAKGHDLPGVTFVGVVSADVSLDLPDFRAAERTFQLLTQVAGRAGRGPRPGRVLVQTLHPDHYCIRAAGDHDYKHFYAQEIGFRRELRYPPFSRMINVKVSGSHEEDTRKVAEAIADKARTMVVRDDGKARGIKVLGPSAAPLARLRGLYRFQLFIKGPTPRVVHAFTRTLMDSLGPFPTKRRVRVHIDVDPIQVL